MERMIYTKAQMLKYLREEMGSLNILPVLIVNCTSFFHDESTVINDVINFAGNNKLIVRSSSKNEDTYAYSNAGKFESVLNVEPNYEAVKAAISSVLDSYDTQENEEVLIQPMLQNVVVSGVVFTADRESLADYYVVNYYEGTDTSAVTSGNKGKLKTFIHYKKSPVSIQRSEMSMLIDNCQKIEAFLNNEALDIEFAIDSNDIVYILQVRPIAEGRRSIAYMDISNALGRIYKKAKKLSAPHPFLLGDSTCFGVMPDWNPAEILGIRPKKLSISLYKELITDNIWAHQRYNYGYRDLTMHPLMISFCGVPYIDTRITFNSFVPQKLNHRIAEKLVNYYLDRLSQYPKYHDKIEFEIVFSCYYLGIHNKLRELLNYGFNDNEITRIEFSLLELTNHIINPQNGLYKQDLEKILTLEENYNTIMQSNISLVDKIYWLIEECKAYGTLPFAGVARAGFIAVQFLRSFVDIGIISQDEYDAYMNSLDTVNKKMNSCLVNYYKGEISKEEFLQIYGHIRPGTYDILSKRYDEAFDEYFGDNKVLDIEEKTKDFSFSPDQLSRIELELEENGLVISAGELLEYIKDSIEGREYLKFVFTKVVSKILQLIEELGTRTDISKEDMAYLDISVVKQLYVDLYTGDIRTAFMTNINDNKKQYQTAIRLKLPSIIVKPEDIYSFYLLEEEPNYITQKNVTADIAALVQKDYDVEGKIVFIQAADPGYDFLFSKRIAGLITQFGGVNSHMAIRCAELGIPAVIGVGEKNFSEWSRYKRITLDCQKRQIIKIS
ncbi:MAG: phosphoenolpyruvate synthase [Lachnospiraceae bacterium]|nr:phosphoenolpyruvate synthase [Lachnospiraceae bacterium]